MMIRIEIIHNAPLESYFVPNLNSWLPCILEGHTFGTLKAMISHRQMILAIIKSSG